VKRLSTPTGLHSAVSQEAVIFKTRRLENLKSHRLVLFELYAKVGFYFSGTDQNYISLIFVMISSTCFHFEQFVQNEYDKCY
jgi:hypothetical protein